MNICAGIVLYNPDIEQLARNVNSIQNYVDWLFFVDNASMNIDEVQGVLSNEHFIWIRNEINTGVAYALNQLMNLAVEKGYDWILTLDQDSVCGEGIVQKLLKAFRHYDNIAMISPKIIDQDIAKTDDESFPDVEEISMCITSGCLTNVRAVLEAGGFDERLFIDQVDHDMCLRLRQRGYYLVRINSAELLQKFGEKSVTRKFLCKEIKYHHYVHSRIFYQTRNTIYMVKKYGTEFTPRPRYYYYHRIGTFCVELLYEPDRIRRLVAFIKGYIAGLVMKCESRGHNDKVYKVPTKAYKP